MCKVDVIDAPVERIGLRLRKGTEGCELNMVHRFSERLMSELKSKGGISRFVFIYEPLVDSGYPDLVSIQYSQTVMRNWCEYSSLFSDQDLKVLSYILSARPNDELLCASLGFSPESIRRSLERLHDSGLAWKTRGRWYSPQRDRVFGIKAITSYEAKMQASSEVHRQAVLNTRFSSESYAILATSRYTQRTRALFEASGVGLLIRGGAQEAVPPRRGSLPCNYVTLKFSQWIGRCMREGILT